MNKSLNQKVLLSISPPKTNLLASFCVLLRTEMKDFPPFLYTWISEFPNFSYTWSLKKCTLPGGASTLYREELRRTDEPQEWRNGRLRLEPRCVLGSFGVVLMSCKVNFHVVPSALRNSMCFLRIGHFREYPLRSGGGGGRGTFSPTWTNLFNLPLDFMEYFYSPIPLLPYLVFFFVYRQVTNWKNKIVFIVSEWPWKDAFVKWNKKSKLSSLSR